MGKQIYFYHDRPVFGLDIGHASLKVMQSRLHDSHREVLGYGSTAFDKSALKDGVIVNPDIINKAMRALFSQSLEGKITSNRVAMALPTSRTFSRSVQLPLLEGKELAEAVQLEAEQYIPMPLQELYMDYTVTSRAADTQELFLVAVPRKIIDSYLVLADMLGLEPILIETTIAAGARLFSHSDSTNVPTVILDFGSQTADISVYDKTTLVSGTVAAGGTIFTEAIQKKLKVPSKKAVAVKLKHGLGVSDHQQAIHASLEPVLQPVVTEIRRMVRYYEERYGTDRRIDQVVMLGGGSNMPGLVDYLTAALRLPVRIHDPWFYLEHSQLSLPGENERLTYGTVAGLSMLNPHEVFPA